MKLFVFSNVYFIVCARYCEGLESVHQFQVTLVDNILVKLMWQEYLFFVDSTNLSRVYTGTSEAASECGSIIYQQSMELPNIKFPNNYLQELGKCIVAILSGIYFMECDLLSIFSVAFREICLEMIQQTDKTGGTTVNVQQIINILSLLEQHSVQQGESWPLIYLVGPMLATCFPLIRAIVSMISFFFQKIFIF